jgi:hypothetical protein
MRNGLEKVGFLAAPVHSFVELERHGALGGVFTESVGAPLWLEVWDSVVTGRCDWDKFPVSFEDSHRSVYISR